MKIKFRGVELFIGKVKSDVSKQRIILEGTRKFDDKLERKCQSSFKETKLLFLLEISSLNPRLKKKGNLLF